MMKGSEIAPEMLILVMIAIAVLAVMTSWILEGKFGGSTNAGDERGRCMYNSDCASGQLCISVNGEDYSCGCLEDANCEGIGGKCVDNKCVAEEQ